MLRNSDYFITKEAERSIFQPIDYFFEGSIEKNLEILPKWLEDSFPNHNKNYNLICVGDIVSAALIHDQILSNHVNMAIVDGKTKGKHNNENLYEKFKELFDVKFEINNKKGMISAKAIKIIKNSLKSHQKTLIIINGEEDLLVVPLIIYSELNSFIIYGQASKSSNNMQVPNGLVVVKVTKGRKKELKKILKHFLIRKRKNIEIK